MLYVPVLPRNIAQFNGMECGACGIYMPLATCSLIVATPVNGMECGACGVYIPLATCSLTVATPMSDFVFVGRGGWGGGGVISSPL